MTEIIVMRKFTLEEFLAGMDNDLTREQRGELLDHIEERIARAVEEVEKWPEDPRYQRRQIEVNYLDGREPYFSIKNQYVTAEDLVQSINEKLAGKISRPGRFLKPAEASYTSVHAGFYRIEDDRLVEFDLEEAVKEKAERIL